MIQSHLMYICNGCKRSIECGHVPSCNEKHHNFQVPDMPQEFKAQENGTQQVRITSVEANNSVHPRCSHTKIK